MGLVLDSSVLIEAERSRMVVSQLLEFLQIKHGDSSFALATMTVMELEHGWHRARSPERALLRRRYLDEVFSVIPIEPFTREMAVRAAAIDASMRAAQSVIATADLVIGVTALQLGSSLVTTNVRHFRMIPGLIVLPMDGFGS